MEEKIKKVKVTVEKLPKSKVRLTIKPSQEDLESGIDKAYRQLAGDVVVKGFRKGKAPQTLIVEQLGEKLFTKGGGIMMQELIERAVIQEQLRPITRAEVVKTDGKEEDKNDKESESTMSFTVEFAIYPAVKIADLHKVTISKNDITKAKELKEKKNEAITEEKPKNKKKSKTSEDKSEEKPEDKAEGKPEDKDKIENAAVEPAEIFSIESYYSGLMDQVISLSEIDLPDELIEAELAEHKRKLSAKLEQLGISFEQYLQIQKKTEEEIFAQWQEEITFSLKEEFLLAEYAIINKLDTSEEEIMQAIKEVTGSVEKVDEEQYNYVKLLLTKQKAFNNIITFIEENGTNTNSN